MHPISRVLKEAGIDDFISFVSLSAKDVSDLVFDAGIGWKQLHPKDKNLLISFLKFQSQLCINNGSIPLTLEQWNALTAQDFQEFCTTGETVPISVSATYVQESISWINEKKADEMSAISEVYGTQSLEESAVVLGDCIRKRGAIDTHSFSTSFSSDLPTSSSETRQWTVISIMNLQF